MELVSQNKQSITVKLSPIELEVLRSALVKESASRRKTWTDVTPVYPEELMYHAVLKESTDLMLYETNKRIKTYKEWGILR